MGAVPIIVMAEIYLDCMGSKTLFAFVGGWFDKGGDGLGDNLEFGIVI